MKTLLIYIAAIGSAAALSACTRDMHEAAPGTPVTDITLTSTEPGAHAAGSPYYVLDEKREGQRLVIDVNVTDLGKAEKIGRKVVNDKKGNATAVTVNVYASDGQPPEPPARTIKWTQEKGFTS